MGDLCPTSQPDGSVWGIASEQQFYSPRKEKARHGGDDGYRRLSLRDAECSSTHAVEGPFEPAQISKDATCDSTSRIQPSSYTSYCLAGRIINTSALGYVNNEEYLVATPHNVHICSLPHMLVVPDTLLLEPPCFIFC